MDVTQLFYADTEVPPLVKSPFLPPERIYVNDRVSALLNDVEVVEWRAAIDSTRQLFARSMNLWTKFQWAKRFSDIVVYRAHREYKFRLIDSSIKPLSLSLFLVCYTREKLGSIRANFFLIRPRTFLFTENISRKVISFSSDFLVYFYLEKKRKFFFFE